MRIWILVLLMLVSATVHAQAGPDLPAVAGLSETVAATHALVQSVQQSSTQPPPNYGNHTQVQAVLDRAISGASNTVIMDLDSALLSNAAKSTSAWTDFDGTIKKLIGGLKSIQLRMFDVEGDVRGKIQPIRDLLKAPQWSRYAAYNSGQDQLEIWSGRDGDRQTGVLLLSVKGKRVFAMNVTGDIRADQLMSLSGRMGIPDINLGLWFPATPVPSVPPPPPPSSR